MIPPPKLDDRIWSDIVDEAMRLIPRYCPEWTNHNPSDPGITIIELLAWLGELMLYRLNRVPEKNYISFLNLMGITLRPPQPAHALLTFGLAEGAKGQTIPAGTQVATPQAAEEEAVVFETARELVCTPVKIDRCFSYHSETYSDNSPFIDGSREDGFEIFGGTDRVERYIYIGDKRFGSLGEGAVLRIHMGLMAETGGRDVARMLEWEYWNGRRWREFSASHLEVERGEVAFMAPGDLAATAVHGIEDFFIRGRLAVAPENPQETELDTIRTRVEVLGEGMLPDAALVNLDNNVFLALDMGKNMFLFGKEPKVDHCLYLASRDLLSQAEAEILIEAVMADTAVIPPPNPSEDLMLVWEYWDGRRWRPLGRSGPRPRAGAGEEFGFSDETRGFTRNGNIRFRRPKDMVAAQVNGEENFWVRVRIEAGNYGRPGSYEMEDDKWVFKDEKPLRPPALRNLAFKYREDFHEVKHCLSYNDFQYRDHAEDAITLYTPFQPFLPVPDESPSVYFGFAAKLPNDSLSFYLHLADTQRLDLDRSYAAELAVYSKAREAIWTAEQRVVWEYYNGNKWAPLVVNDGSKNFTESGFVDFVGPDDLTPCLKFTEERHWIRARLEHGGYVQAPRIRRILQNTVAATHTVTLRDETMGSSDGTPLQEFTFSQKPALEGATIEIREREPPSAQDIADLGDDPVRAVIQGEPGFWVRWKPVEGFYESGPRSRHYLFDGIAGKLQFGDGLHGMVPPLGRNNIVARRYQVGGGLRGNVTAGQLTSLSRAIAYIDGVTNCLPAGGGANAETVEEAKVRAPLLIKSRDRAVTAEDFESLAIRASNSVARAKCLPSTTREGEVTLILIPKGNEGRLDLTRRLAPAPELLRHVMHYLEERKLVGTVLEVIKPRYVELSLTVRLMRRTVGASDRLRRDIEDRLRRYLHALIGGRDGKGWQFGRPVLKSELVRLVEDVPGVEAVDDIQVYHEDLRVTVEQVRLAPDELPFLVGVQVVERVREEIA